MSKIKQKYIRFTPAENDGAINYKVYIVPAGVACDYDTAGFDVGTQTNGIEIPVNTPEGNIDVYVGAEDSAGNMSDLVRIVENYPLDMTPPLSPVGGEIY